MSTAFDHALTTYPHFASQIIFELWKNNSITPTDSTPPKGYYYVRMRINDKNVTLQHDCGGQETCDLKDFEGLASKVSFYGDDEGYRKLCNRDPKPMSVV